METHRAPFSMRKTHPNPSREGSDLECVDRMRYAPASEISAVRDLPSRTQYLRICNPRPLQIKRAAAGIANPRVPASGLQIRKSSRAL